MIIGKYINSVTVDIISAVALLYVVLTTVGILTYCIGHTAIPAHIYVHIPIRVGVHICVYTQGKGVAQFMARTRSYTPDSIYLYKVYLDIIRAPIWGPFFHLTPKYSAKKKILKNKKPLKIK